MQKYRHTQPGTTMLVAMAIVFITIAVSALELSNPPVVFVLSFLVIVTFLFSSLTVQIDESELVWYFGPKFWKKNIPLSEIAFATPTKTKWYWGIGIRLTPQGWLYNVSGLSAVKVVLKSGETILIGTNDSAKLTNTLSEVI